MAGTRAAARTSEAHGDPVRLQRVDIVVARASGEACGCDLTAPCSLSPPTASQHLDVVCEVRLLEGERRAEQLGRSLVALRGGPTVAGSASPS